MKYIIFGAAFFWATITPLWAWDGFDADSADLVEIIPDQVPNPGETITVKNYDTKNSQPCIVESVRRNSRTIEIVVLNPDNTVHTLVMEGR